MGVRVCGRRSAVGCGPGSSAGFALGLMIVIGSRIGLPVAGMALLAVRWERAAVHTAGALAAGHPAHPASFLCTSICHTGTAAICRCCAESARSVILGGVAHLGLAGSCAVMM